MQTLSPGKRTLVQGVFALLTVAAWHVWSIQHAGEQFAMPPPGQVGRAFLEYLVSGELLRKAFLTMEAVAVGLGIGIGLALIFTSLALFSRRMASVVELLTTMLHPMPSVAMLPLVILWIGIGFPGVVALIVNSCLWPMLLNSYMGFRAVHRTYLEVGRNVGLRGVRLIVSVMVPSALPYLLAGLKTAWARSWQTVIAAEMVFGTVTGAEGLGWFIFEAMEFVDFARIIAGIVVIVIIGLLMERVVFEWLERQTILKWGMSR